VDLRLVVGCGLICALAAGGIAATGERDYRARAYVIQVPPRYAGEQGVARARSEPILLRALALSGVRGRDPRWLRDHSDVSVTSRRDLAFSVRTTQRAESAALATAYAKAFRRSIPTVPGLPTRGRGARDAQPEMGPFGWALLGGAGGLWLGAALAILLDGLLNRGSGQAARPASPPSAPARRATPG
jgi:hypothetical protein